MTRFTAEFGMGSGGSTSLWSPSKTGNKRDLKSLIVCVAATSVQPVRIRADNLFYVNHSSKRLGRYMVKPHEPLVQVRSMPYSTYTPCLSTSWSRTALQGPQGSSEISS